MLTFWNWVGFSLIVFCLLLLFFMIAMGLYSQVRRTTQFNNFQEFMKPFTQISFTKDGDMILDSYEALPSTSHNFTLTEEKMSLKFGEKESPTPQEYQSLLPNIQRLAMRIAEATPMYPVDAAWDDPEEWQSDAAFLAHAVLRLLSRLPKSS